MITPTYGLTATERVLPRLALDFTTAMLDPRITFTRALNTATRVNSSGNIEVVNADLPRFDYNPITLACNGLLIEESRSNITPYSVYSVGNWTFQAASLGSDTKTAPDGTTATAFLSDATTTAHRVIRAVTDAYTANQTYTFSFFVAKSATSDIKGMTVRVRSATGGQTVNFIVSNAGENSTYTFFSSGPFGASAPPAITASNVVVTPYSNKWSRIQITTTVSTVNTNFTQWDIGFSSVTGSESGAGTANSQLFIWGAQLEVGAFATSYIPTTTTSVTRNADVATMTGTNFSDWYNASEGVFVADFSSVDVGSGRFPNVITASNGTTAERIFLALNAGARRAAVYSSSANQYDITGGTIGTTTANAFNRLAVAYKVNDFTSAAMGSLSVTDTSGVTPTVDKLNLGSSATSTNPLNGNLIALRFYPQRLINAEVQAFSK